MGQSSVPGPVGHWGGVHHLQAIRADFRVFAHDLHQKYGDLLTYRVLGQQIYQVASPELAHEVLVSNAKSLEKPRSQKRAFGRIIGNNLFTSDGATWFGRRRLLGPLFQPQIIDRYRESVIKQASHVWGQVSGGEVNVSETASKIALLSVSEALFGASVHDQADRFLEVATQLQGAISRQILSPFLLPLWIPTRDNRTVRSALKFFHDFMSSLIDQRRRSPGEHADLLTALLNATDADDGKRLTDREAMDEAMTILLAGSDTTAAALSWSSYLLARHPEVQDELHAEIIRLTGGGPLHAQHAGQLSVSQAVFQESMRLYPPGIAIARQAKDPIEIGGVQIPRGALVFVIVYSIHHDARWFPAPEVFRPDRFAPGHEAEVPEHAYLPFGLGPRACIGRRFALMEGTLVLAELIRRFDIQLTDPSFEPELENQLSLHPRNGLRLRLKRREK